MAMYLNLKKANVLWMLLVSMAFSHEVLASQYGNLSGVFKGKQWSMKTAIIIKTSEAYVLEFFDQEFSDEDICKAKRAKKLLVEIPLSVGNGTINHADEEGANFHFGANDGTLSPVFGYFDLKLKKEDLNSVGSAFMNGRLNFSSSKAKTEVNGTFTARVCNLE